MTDFPRAGHIRRAALAVLALLALVTGLRVLPGVLVDYWWFRALGHSSVYVRMLSARALLWLVGFTGGFVAVGSGIVLAARRLGAEPVMFYRWGRWTVRAPSLRRWVLAACWAMAVLAGLTGASLGSAMWHRVLLLLHRQPFGTTDPIFGNDVGFYVFTYPVLATLLPLVQVGLWISLGVSGLLYLSNAGFMLRRPGVLSQAAVIHLSRMVAAILVATSASYLLQRYRLLYSGSGAAYGAGYTDVKARLPAYWLMAAAGLGVAGICLSVRSASQFRRAAAAIAAWFACALVVLYAGPAVVQRYHVEPNELAAEQEFIANSIEQTSAAYGLDRIQRVEYPVTGTLDYAGVRAEGETIANVRLWDEGPLAEIYRQKQGLRPYYDFTSIGVDRYRLEDGVSQVMLSVRELRQEALPQKARTWVNRRLQYTHGYGLCVGPVNEHDLEGFPVPFVSDIPPVSVPGLEVREPRIYYGEETRDYVIVGTDTEEFDYPMEDENRYTRYGGTGGIPLTGSLRKLAFAVHLGDVNILLSGELGKDSRILHHRQVAERVSRLAPYLMLDRNPYAVVADGRVYWVQDAYTTTRMYPYSEPTPTRRLNYIRNSVKAVVDAYNGTVHLYVSDGSDPLVRAYGRMFPGLYRPITQMPEGLRSHLRYPRDLFDVQAEKYQTYHMQDPRVFYNHDDPWQPAVELYQGQNRRVESYYVTMRPPGAEKAEFILMVPFTPERKQNMVAWLAARCDGESYGELVALMFPKGKLVNGPYQVEMLIDQDTVISGQLTLWSQHGSRVIRGNLLVIPVAGDVLYVEPLFIQAEAGALPQLQRVITAYGDQVAMAETFEASLRALFTERAERPLDEEAPERATLVPRAAHELVRRALDEYVSAQEALKRGDWAAYGAHMASVEAALSRADGVLKEGPPGDGN
jgi:uncharacterized membrane protein (UPF0182 family)